MSKCNQMIFDLTNSENLKLAQDFITSLISHNIESKDDFADIHIYQEEDLVIVEWAQVFYNVDFPQDHFVLLDSDHSLVKEVMMPDNSILCIFQGEYEDEAINRWHDENPGWVKRNNSWVFEPNEKE